MGRPRKQPHALTLRERHGQAACWYAGREWAFGPWDKKRNAPAPDALAAFQKQVAEWVRNPAAGRTRAGELLGELWADWVNSAAAAPADPNGEVRNCGRHLFGDADAPGPHAGTLVDEFGPPELAAFQLALCGLTWADGPKAGRTRYGRDMIRRQVRYVWRCFQWGVESGRVRYEQYAALRLVAPPRRGQVREPVKRRAVLWEQVERTLPHVTPAAVPVLLTLWHTGARPEEVCQLTVGMIHTAGVIQAQSGVPIDLTQLGVWAAVPSHKSERHGLDRVLFFGPLARAVLAPLVADRPPLAPLFPTTRGSAYTHRGLHQAVERACRRHGLPHWCPRQLRHSFAVRCQAAHGYDATRAALGHRGRGVTSVYSGPDLLTAAKVANDLG